MTSTTLGSCAWLRFRNSLSQLTSRVPDCLSRVRRCRIWVALCFRKELHTECETGCWRWTHTAASQEPHAWRGWAVIAPTWWAYIHAITPTACNKVTPANQRAPAGFDSISVVRDRDLWSYLGSPLSEQSHWRLQRRVIFITNGPIIKPIIT